MGCWRISRLLLHHYMLRQHDFNDATLAAYDDGRTCSLVLIVVFAVYLWLCALLLLVFIMKLMR